MEAFVPEDITMFCRTCMAALPEDNDPPAAPAPTSAKHNISDNINLAGMLMSCTSLPFESTDEYPKCLCDACFVKVNDFHEFRVMCVESLQRFEELRQLCATRLFEDEKPNFDLDIQLSSPMMVEEHNVLAGAGQYQNGAYGKSKRKPTRRSRRKWQVKELVDSTETEIPDDADEVKNSATTHAAEECTEIVVKVEDHTSDEMLAAELSDTPCATHEIESDREELTNAHTKKLPVARKRRSTVKLKPTAAYQPSNGRPCVKVSTLQCDVCPARFLVEHRLAAHKRTHDGLPAYPCPYEDCGKSFNRRHCLSQHLKQHEGTSNWYTCEQKGCGKVYKHKPTLVLHQRKCHQIGPEPKKHICEICGKVFKTFGILSDHRYTHRDSSERPFACDVSNCQRRFTKKEKLKVHLMRHAGIKNFVCPHCGMRKTTRNELNVHINYHTLERTWPCRFCDHVCNSAGNLRMHVRTVHERAKDYGCQYCERTFAKPDTRKYHEMTHTGEKPHKCRECGKCFTQPAALRTHRKIHDRQRMHLAAAALSANAESVAGCETELIVESQQESAAQTQVFLQPVHAMDEVTSMQELLQPMHNI